MGITASMVRELREMTGLGMMDCKKALAENEGDFDQARDWLRKRGAVVAEKKLGRAATEGSIAAGINGKFGVLVELNTETDFVAHNDDFKKFASQVASIVANNGSVSEDISLIVCKDTGDTLEKMRQVGTMQLGENIQFGKVSSIEAKGTLYTYIHHDLSIGVIADLEGGDEQLGRDICLQIAAMKPKYVSADQISATEAAKEKEIYTAQAKQSGKPPEVIEKMVVGRLKKYFAEISLAEQAFVKQPEITVAKVLKEKNAKIHNFICLLLSGGAS